MLETLSSTTLCLASDEHAVLEEWMILLTRLPQCHEAARIMTG
jgi:hypothetical protein